MPAPAAWIGVGVVLGAVVVLPAAGAAEVAEGPTGATVGAVGTGRVVVITGVTMDETVHGQLVMVSVVASVTV